MSLLDIGAKGYEMLEAYAAFRKLLDEYREDEGNGEYEGPRDIEDAPEPDAFAALLSEEDFAPSEEEQGELPTEEEAEEANEGDYDFIPGSGYDAFPGRRTFTMSDIQDEESFYRGREIGIPLTVAVRVSPDQGKQLPIAGLGALFARRK